MNADTFARLRDLLGDSSLSRIGQIDGSTVERIAAGQATLQPEAAERIRAVIRAAAALVDGGAEPTPFTAIFRLCGELEQQKPEHRLPAVRAWCALMTAPDRRMALTDLSRKVAGKPQSAVVCQAVERLAALGRVRIALERMPLAPAEPPSWSSPVCADAARASRPRERQLPDPNDRDIPVPREEQERRKPPPEQRPVRRPGHFARRSTRHEHLHTAKGFNLALSAHSFE